MNQVIGQVGMGAGGSQWQLSASLGSVRVPRETKTPLMDATKLLRRGIPNEHMILVPSKISWPESGVRLFARIGCLGRPSEAIIALRTSRGKSNRAGEPPSGFTGRAYSAGSLDLAESAFKQLQVSNPPEAAKDGD